MVREQRSGPAAPVPPPPGRPDQCRAMLEFAERLPGASCALDLRGAVTFATSAALRLLGREAAELLGAPLWQAVPWLDDPAYQDRYRAALISRQPVSFTVIRPPDQWLEFRLYPDATGVSVRIAPALATAESPASRTAPDPEPAMEPGTLYHLVKLTGALTEAVSVRDVVALVAEEVMPAFGADGLVMYVADSGRLRVVGYRGYTAEAMAYFDGVPLDRPLTPAARALTEGEPGFFESAEAMQRAYPGLPNVTGKSAWAVLPLIASGHPVGACVLSYRRPRSFPAEERTALGSHAALVAQALDRARLFDTRQQLAYSLQARLLPATLPDLPGVEAAARYLPATRGMDIGGDFYDLIRLDDSSAAAVIGDVQGHNVTAAVLMGQVRTAIHAYATTGASPGEILAGTNRLLVELGQGLFASCLYAHLDLTGRRAVLAAAGHPPPLLRGADRRAAVLPLPTGLLLGIDPAAEYPAAEIALQPGSVLAFYTDGLIEAPGTDLDAATDELARRLADTPGDLEHLADAVIRQAHASRHHTDDIALLLISPSAGAFAQ